MTAALSPVAATAVAIAAERAAESARPDRLFDDPLAARFVAATTPAGERPAPPLGETVPVMAGYVALRTRWFDDRLLASGCEQVVLLGAGLDARAFRLPWPPATRLFELDTAELLAFKEPLVASAGAGAADGAGGAAGAGAAAFAGSSAGPRCRRTVVAADLRDGWAEPLRAAGFDPERPTAWLAEGLLMYLSPAENDRLLATVGALSAPGSLLLAEHVPAAGARPAARDGDGQVRDGGQSRDGDGHLLDAGGASWRSTHDDPVAWLESAGWRAGAADAAAVARALGRPVPPVLDGAAVGDACAWLLRAER
jgi:O-methyltransferase involved in polyketide biosynthesis